MSTLTARRAHDPSLIGTGREWRWIAAIMLGVGWGGNEFTPMLSVYRERAGYSQLDVDVLLGAYVLGLLPGLLLAAAASDRIGRRPVLLLGVVSSGVGSLVLALGARVGFDALFVGRTLSGVAVGVAMAVGTAWVSELSTPAYDPGARPGTGARRGAIALTLGFGAGPAIAGVLAQWGPAPLATPFLLHAGLTVGSFVALRRHGTETRQPDRSLGLAARLRVPAVGHRRFLWVILPMAPWIFGSAGIAYAVVPQLVAPRLGHWTLIYASVMTVATLGAGIAVQPIARRLDSRSSARAVLVSMILMSVGVAAAAVAAISRSPWLGVPVALLLGGAYGIAVVSGLLELQRIAPADELAGLTGVYYALAYIGFLVPAVLAALSHWLSYPILLAGLTVIALGSVAVIASAYTRHLPQSEPLPSAPVG